MMKAIVGPKGKYAEAANGLEEPAELQLKEHEDMPVNGEPLLWQRKFGNRENGHGVLWLLATTGTRPLKSL